MPDLKIPVSYLSRNSGGKSGQPLTFEREIIKRWREGKGRKDRQAVIDIAYENQKMSTYEYILASLTLERKK